MNEKELYDYINRKGFSEAVEDLNCEKCPLHPSHCSSCNSCSGDSCEESLANFYLRFNNESKEPKVLVALSNLSTYDECFVKVPKSYLKFLDFLEANEFLHYKTEEEKVITEF